MYTYQSRILCADVYIQVRWLAEMEILRSELSCGRTAGRWCTDSSDIRNNSTRRSTRHVIVVG
jgi:hypothetical protein